MIGTVLPVRRAMITHHDEIVGWLAESSTDDASASALSEHTHASRLS